MTPAPSAAAAAIAWTAIATDSWGVEGNARLASAMRTVLMTALRYPDDVDSVGRHRACTGQNDAGKTVLVHEVEERESGQRNEHQERGGHIDGHLPDAAGIAPFVEVVENGGKAHSR